MKAVLREVQAVASGAPNHIDSVGKARRATRSGGAKSNSGKITMARQEIAAESKGRGESDHCDSTARQG
jgi:hypothetical protein